MGTTPLNKSWFLRVDTSSFPGSGRAESYWTYWKICATGGGQCGSTIPALPFGAAWVGGTEGVPAGLTGTHYKDTTSTYYYYMEIRLGFLPHLHCTNRLHLPHEPARSLQSLRLRIVWLSVGILSLLVLSRSCADDCHLRQGPQ